MWSCSRQPACYWVLVWVATLPRVGGVSCYRTFCSDGGTMPCSNQEAITHELTDCLLVDDYNRGDGMTAQGQPYDVCQRVKMEGPSYLGFPEGGDVSYRCASSLESERVDYHCGECSSGHCADDWGGNGLTVVTGRITRSFWCCVGSGCNVPQTGGARVEEESGGISLQDWMAAVREADTGCPPGSFAEYSTLLLCTDCPVGQADIDSDPVTPCVACQPGSSAQVKSVGCTECIAGRVGHPQVSGCTDCAPGQFTGSVGGVLGCSSCSQGTYAAAAASDCTSCTAVGKHDHDADPATPCASGFRYFQSAAWQLTRRCHKSCEEMGGVAAVGVAGNAPQTCCAGRCGSCEVSQSCAFNTGGWSNCCPTHTDGGILASGKSCLDHEPPVRKRFVVPFD
jgi:hypothetical protein